MRIFCKSIPLIKPAIGSWKLMRELYSPALSALIAPRSHHNGTRRFCCRFSDNRPNQSPIQSNSSPEGFFPSGPFSLRLPNNSNHSVQVRLVIDVLDSNQPSAVIQLHSGRCRFVKVVEADVGIWPRNSQRVNLGQVVTI